jgi:multicomponent K+:H+ antiporter subunit G
MNGTDALPAWAALLVATLVVAGALITLIGSFGLLRLRNFYERAHAPTLGATLGTGAILIASMIFFTVLKGRPSVHEILIAVFVTLTTPVTLMMLARATLYRDRVEGGSASPKSTPAAGAASNRAGEGQPDNITGAREI